MAKTTVLITGANGFLALHIIHQLLDRGYAVIGTVRSEDKAVQVRRAFEYHLDLKVLVIKDFTVRDIYRTVFQWHKTIAYVIHTATPSHHDPNQDLVTLYRGPAVKGTLEVLASTMNYGLSVRKVIITSSFVAVVQAGSNSMNPKVIHNEQMWNPIQWDDVAEVDGAAAFAASKTMAERAAWEYVNSNRLHFKVNTVIHPVLLGPQRFDQQASPFVPLDNSSLMVRSLMNNDPDDPYSLLGPITTSVDIRDLAAVHIIAMENPNIAGQRLLPMGHGFFSISLVIDVIYRNFPSLRGRFNPEHFRERLKQDIDLVPIVDNSNTMIYLDGFQFIPFEKTIIDTVDQMIAMDLVESEIINIFYRAPWIH